MRFSLLHSGSRKKPDTKSRLSLYQLRHTAGLHTMRCVEMPAPVATSLRSRACHLLRVPFDADRSGIIYVWFGKHTSEVERSTAEKIGQLLRGHYTLQTLNEGEEPENFFWTAMGGKKPYGTEPLGKFLPRLFRCSNEAGFFHVEDCGLDFCEDDLAHDDCMLLDALTAVFVWVGPASSDVEVKLAVRSAQVCLCLCVCVCVCRPRRRSCGISHR
jgi:hypothetical protein